MRAKTSFLANISHEIRTPLHGVLGMADLLSSTALSEEQKLFTDTIKTSSESLLVILKDVLDYSKMEADRLTLRRQNLTLRRQSMMCCPSYRIKHKPKVCCFFWIMTALARLILSAIRAEYGKL